MYSSLKKSFAVVASIAALTLGGTATAYAHTNAADPVAVPDVVGLPGTTAVEELEDAGFTDVHVTVPGSDRLVLSSNLIGYSSAPADKPILLLLR